MNSRSFSLCAVAALAVVSSSFAHCPAFADNSMIPPSLFSYRDSLLEEKQDLLKQRSDLTIRLTSLETAKRQCDVFLAGDITKDEHDRLIAARAAVADRINYLQGWLEGVQHDLIANDSDLRECESRMTRWACLK